MVEDAPTNKVKVAYDPNDHTCATFMISNEGHTIGNALRNIVARRPDVDLCAYTIPHPIEPVMNFRVQTRDSATPKNVVIESLATLKEMTQIVQSRLLTALDSSKPMES
ncbi:hypothetical protein RCL1_000835 [Eukaryota sp. TZLM3-RCL]